jgi:glutamate-1-semialdehyde 2,1-aminomutase
VAAGRAAVDYLESQPSLYRRLDLNGQRWADGLAALAREHGFAAWGNRVGSISTLFFTEGPVRDFDSAMKSDTALYGAFWRGMLERGVWLAPSQFEASFVSTGFLPDDIDQALDAADETFKAMKK